jgi:cell division protein FtsB
MAATAEPENAPGRKSHARLLKGLALGLGFLLVFLVIFNQRGVYQVYNLRQEYMRLEQENARLAEENTRLARTISRLQNDPEMIQDLIRRELNYVKKNEIIVQLAPATKGKENLWAVPLPQAPVLKGHPGKGETAENRKQQGGRKSKASP